MAPGSVGGGGCCAIATLTAARKENPEKTTVEMIPRRNRELFMAVLSGVEE